MKKKFKTVAKLPDGIRYMVDGKKILVTETETFEVKCEDSEWPTAPSLVLSFGGPD